MPLKDEIERVRGRAIDALNDAHDYFTYTKTAWRTLQLDVQRDDRKITWQYLHTKSATTEKDILARAQRYVAIDLASSTLQQFVSIFENFLFDSARAWILAHPKCISSRQLSGKDLLDLPDKAAIIDALVEKELKEVSGELVRLREENGQHRPAYRRRGQGVCGG